MRTIRDHWTDVVLLMSNRLTSVSLSLALSPLIFSYGKRIRRRTQAQAVSHAKITREKCVVSAGSARTPCIRSLKMRCTYQVDITPITFVGFAVHGLITVLSEISAERKYRLSIITAAVFPSCELVSAGQSGQFPID